MKSLTLEKGELGLELPHDKGNWVLLKDLGYSPVQLLVASIAACGQYVFKSVLERSSIPGTLGNVWVDYEVDDASKSHQLTKVSIRFDMTTDIQNQEKATRALRLVNEYCPVIQSLDPKIHIEKSIQFIG